MGNITEDATDDDDYGGDDDDYYYDADGDDDRVSLDENMKNHNMMISILLI